MQATTTSHDLSNRSSQPVVYSFVNMSARVLSATQRIPDVAAFPSQTDKTLPHGFCSIKNALIRPKCIFEVAAVDPCDTMLEHIPRPELAPTDVSHRAVDRQALLGGIVGTAVEDVVVVECNVASL